MSVSSVYRSQKYFFFFCSVKPGVVQYVAIRATVTARDFSLAIFHPSGPLTCIFSKSLHPTKFCPLFAVANISSCIGPHNEKGHPAHGYSPHVKCLLNINRLLNMCYCFSGFILKNCGYNFDFLRKTDVFYRIWSVLCWFLCEMFDRVVVWERETCGLMTCGLTNRERDWNLCSALT